MGRRRFEHLVVELSVAAGRSIPRYRLWMRLHDLGWNPEDLEREEVLAFCDGPLGIFLAEVGIRLGGRSIRRLRREVSRFEPDVLSPYDRVAQRS